MLKRGAEEPLPKVTIHLPPTPAVEVPPPLTTPTLKIGPKSASQIKLASRKASFANSPQTATATSPTDVRRSPAIVPLKVPPVATATQQPVRSTLADKPAMHKKKEKALPKAQARGMSAHDYKACRSALKRLTSNKHAALFLQPVDPIRDRAPK